LRDANCAESGVTKASLRITYGNVSIIFGTNFQGFRISFFWFEVADSNAVKQQNGPGFVAQWTSHPSQEQRTRVQFPPGHKVFITTRNADLYNGLNMYCVEIDT
jgi:hypothetical protein